MPDKPLPPGCMLPNNSDFHSTLPQDWVNYTYNKGDPDIRIRTFNEEFAQHPGRKMWQEYIQAYAYLEPEEQAWHKLQDSETWRNYQLAQKYGIGVYNVVTSGGTNT